MILYFINGIANSAFAALFIYLFTKIQIFKNKLNIPYIRNRWFYILTTSTIISLI